MTTVESVAEVPDTQYAVSDDGLAIAYQTVGDGPTDIVVVPMFYAVDAMWEDPSYAHALRRLARLGRLIVLDYRGFGGSDRPPLGALPTPEQWMEDLRVVLDAVGSTACHIVQQGGGGEFLGMLFAAAYPDRTKTLTLMNATARVAVADGYDIGVPHDLLERFIEREVRTWGTPRAGALYAPSRAQDDTFLRWFARYQRAAISPGTHGRYMPWVLSLDMRAVLPSIRVPTLVLCRPDNTLVPCSHSHHLVAHIPGATLVELAGSDYWFFDENVDEFVDIIESFITGVPVVADADRALATVLFTDIVSSTEHVARIGDRRWSQLLDQHDAVTSRELERHRGRKVNPTGDGLLATFDGPARAVRCAQAIRDGLRPLGIDIRAGLHVGEVEFRGDDIGGIAVHIGQRISSLAGAGEILVSRTVTDLVVGSGLIFEDRGDYHLKGIEGSWQVFAVQS